MMSSQTNRLHGIIGFIILCLTSPALFAALSPKLSEWGKGPAQWIMTSDDRRAWRNVKTDIDAIHFIDLFWVRRDPTPGTPVNEFRNEFESRVAYSDATWAEQRKRGAMTDRGRVYIVLGTATNMAAHMRQTTSQQGVADTSGDPTGGRQMGARDVWIWEHADAQKFDMGRIEVVFVEDPTTHRVQRDPGRTDFGTAGPAAIRKAIVNSELTEIPDWAPTGGLEPVFLMVVEEEPEAVAVISPPSPITGATPLPDEPTDEGPAVASDEPGASRLTLLKSPIDPRSATDPFTAVTSERTFTSRDDLSWAVQYCAAEAEIPKLKFIILIAGPLDGQSTERVTREKDSKPARINALPGCYVLQGTQSLRKLTPGRYKFGVLIDDPVSGDSYDVKTEFRIE